MGQKHTEVEQTLQQRLIEAAKLAMDNAYVPYSQFRVGAAVLTDDGSIYSGCNVENVSYGLTNCAERTAVFKAVSEGAHRVQAVAIVGDTEQPIAPCGACRQVLAEFADSQTPVYLVSATGQVKHCTLEELLPYAFRQL